MKSVLLIPAVALALLGIATAQERKPAAEHHAIHRPAEIKWVDGPPSLPPGAKVALLEGDPAKEGFFTMEPRTHWRPMKNPLSRSV